MLCFKPGLTCECLGVLGCLDVADEDAPDAPDGLYDALDVLWEFLWQHGIE